MSTGYEGVGIAKADGWTCHQCGYDNKLSRSCKRCGHEPTLGRRDTNPEGRTYTTDSEPDARWHRDEEE